MRGETVTSPMNYSNASDVKDAFIKGWLHVSDLEISTFECKFSFDHDTIYLP